MTVADRPLRPAAVVTGLIVRSELQDARTAVHLLRQQVSDGDLAAARVTLAGLQTNADRAHTWSSGPAWAFGPYRDVSRALVVGFGSASLSPAGITSLSLFRWVSRDARWCIWSICHWINR